MPYNINCTRAVAKKGALTWIDDIEVDILKEGRKNEFYFKIEMVVWVITG